jgi:aryl-alcohol dehydrogenase-like predicted oxidoreductase
VWTPSPSAGQAQIETALSRFGGRVDIYQIHNLVAWQEHLPVLEDLRASGAARVIGATHYAHNALDDLMTVMRTGRIQMVQIPYNAADRVVEREVLPLAHELGLGVLIMQPLGTGKLTRTSPAPRELAPLEQFGVTTWAQVLLKWILSDARVHSVIPATSKPERATENAAAGNAPWFDEEARARISALARESLR